MEIIFRSKDIADIIKTYYRKLEGFNVDVFIMDESNIDKTFLIKYDADENQTLTKYIDAHNVNARLLGHV